MEEYKQIVEKLIQGDTQAVQSLTEAALGEGSSPHTILEELIAGLDIVGEKFSAGEAYLPEMLIAGKAMQGALGILRPKLVEAGTKPIGKAVIGTVKGDVHDIGKNMIGMMLEGAGFEVLDLGCDVATEKFVQAVKENEPQILAMSGLLSTTIPEMPVVIDALKEAGLRDQLKILIGGAPVTEKYAQDIGADAGGVDAAVGAGIAKKYLKGN